MKAVNRSNALLVELLIVIAFFMLSSTVILQLFGAARNQSDKARSLLQAQTEAQNIAEVLYASDDTQKALTDMGFSEEAGVWQLVTDNRITQVQEAKEDQAAGVMHTARVSIIENGEELISIPIARYEEVLQ